MIDAPATTSLRRLDVPVLRQAVAILVDTAVRYAVEGTIRIAVSVRDDHLSVSVRDEGPGFSAARASGGGAGLGIRLCELLARRAGGALTLAQDGPAGTEFVVRLPARV